MQLSPDDLALFYKLMWPLQFYINQQLNILPDVESVERYSRDYAYEQKLPVRDALYEHPELIDAFIAENPTHLNAEELSIIQSWKSFVKGDFYIERFLKAGAIFIGSGDRVYLVQGLSSSVQDVLGVLPLPIMVKTVLLPFKGRIVYDGLFQPYNVFFGGGIKGDLKETYLTAKQNRRIIETLEPNQPITQPKPKSQQPARDWRPEVDQVVEIAGKLKGGQAPFQKEAFSLLKTSAELAQRVVHQPEDLDALWKAAGRVDRALGRLGETLNRAER